MLYTFIFKIEQNTAAMHKATKKINFYLYPLNKNEEMMEKNVGRKFPVKIN